MLRLISIHSKNLPDVFVVKNVFELNNTFTF